jgi:hypothetical protein
MNDAEALEHYLRRSRSTHTRRAAAGEVRRLMMWLHHTKIAGTSTAANWSVKTSTLVRDMSEADAVAFIVWLRAPATAQQLSEATLAAFEREAQPIRGPLQDSSVRQALLYLHGWINGMCRVNTGVSPPYRDANPFSKLLAKERNPSHTARERSRALNEEIFQACLETTDLLAAQAATGDPGQAQKAKRRWARARAILMLVRWNLVSISDDRLGRETPLRWSQFHPPQPGWSDLWTVRLEVLESNTSLDIPVPEVLINELERLRFAHGLIPALPARGNHFPVLLRLGSRRHSIGHDVIYKEITQVLAETARRFNGGDPAIVATLQAATPHSVRK